MKWVLQIITYKLETKLHYGNQRNGEVQSTALEIYYNGIKVTSDNSEIITKINNLGFSVENNNGKILITVNKDEAVLADTNIDGVLRQSRWKRQIINIESKEHLTEVYE